MVARLLQTVVDERERLHQLFRGPEALAVDWRRLPTMGQGLSTNDRPLKHLADDHQDLTVGLLHSLLAAVKIPVLGLVSAASFDFHSLIVIIVLMLGKPFQHLAARLSCHRERPKELLDLVVVQPACSHHGEVDDLLGDVMGDIWVSIAISSHPRAEGDEVAVQWKGGLAQPSERVVDNPVVLRDRIPQSLFDDTQAIARFILWRRLDRPHVVRSPDRQQSLLEAHEDQLLL
mmetsp:Transcript_5832/g.20574  ORF Transcript_5832/g.20574 Transcript_5832/m.20574 type:complete len:232 (+) Transcript_5832:1979-2674(+)